jgi:ATP-binding cassette subfamily B (MDR/TAP) protein 1
MEMMEIKNYNKYLIRARQVGIKQAWQNALGISGIFSYLFLFYAYAFAMGSILILNKTMNGDAPYKGGDVAACLFGIIFGAFSVGGAMPNVKAFVEGKVSGHAIYKTIDRVPKIPLNDTTKKILNPEKLRGEIKFENVNFTYPTRPEQ